MPQILQTDDLQGFLDELLSNLIDLIPNAQTGSILLLEDEYLRYKAAKGYDLEKLNSMYLIPEPEFLIALSNKVNLFHNLRDWNSHNLKKNQFELLSKHGGIESIKVIISFPLFNEDGEIYGEFNIENHDSEDAFTDEDVLIVEKFKHIAEQLVHSKLRTIKLNDSVIKLLDYHDKSLKLYDDYSHDIKNELHAIMLMASLIENDIHEKLKEQLIKQIDQMNRLGEKYQSLIINSLKDNQLIIQKLNDPDFVFLKNSLIINKCEVFDCEINVVIRDSEEKLLFEMKIDEKLDKDKELISIFKNFSLLGSKKTQYGYSVDIILKIYKENHENLTKVEKLIYPRQKQLLILLNIQGILLDHNLQLLRRSRENYKQLIKFFEEKLVNSLNNIPEITEVLTEEWKDQWYTSKSKIKDYLKSVLDSS